MKKNKPIFISYYSDGNGYDFHAKRLIQSLQRFNLDFRVYKVPNIGNWVHNVRRKPRFIAEALKGAGGRPVVWVDCDAVIQENPVYFDDLVCDIGVHFKGGVELLSGTVYVDSNPNTLRLMQRWNEFQDESGWPRPQQCLDHVLKEAEFKDLVINRLPPAYCQIYDLMAHEGEPVIEHFQASRSLRT